MGKSTQKKALREAGARAETLAKLTLWNVVPELVNPKSE